MSNSPDLMLRSSYYYDLPQQLIAQTPAEKRDMSRLLVLDRKTGEVTHRHFHDITDYLRAGDCLVINDTKVIPSRLFAKIPYAPAKRQLSVTGSYFPTSFPQRSSESATREYALWISAIRAISWKFSTASG